MNINGILTDRLSGYQHKVKAVNIRGSGFADHMREAYHATAVQGSKEISSLDSMLPMETERYVIRNASDIEGVPAYAIYDKQLGKYAYIREDQLAIQKDSASGFAFVIDMNQPLCNNVRVTDELRGLLNDLAEKRNIELPEVPLQGGLTVNRDSQTGLHYLTIQGNEAKGVSVIITSKEDMDTIESLVDEFMQYSTVIRDREIAGLYALLEISGNLKRESDGFTYLTPDGISYTPYNGDHRTAWYIPYSRLDYSKAREFLGRGSNLSDAYTWLGVFPKAKVVRPDIKPLSQYKKDQAGEGFQYVAK